MYHRKCKLKTWSICPYGTFGDGKTKEIIIGENGEEKMTNNILQENDRICTLSDCAYEICKLD